MTAPSVQITRRRLVVQGNVQGVGFRPFVYRLATSLGLTGNVRNVVQGVRIEIEGPRGAVERFSTRLLTEHPPHASIATIEQDDSEAHGDTHFSIYASCQEGAADTFISPDLATCEDCLRELFDPTDHRYLYPFINCTNCGPRYSIVKALPYDRRHTTMHDFTMCDSCQQEYDNPHNRRFHAQPNACHACGPQLALWGANGRVQAQRQQALSEAVAAIQSGHIVAVKGLGGFHLMLSAYHAQAIDLLRQRKSRPHKPFAVMYPDLMAIQQDCLLSDSEAQLLSSPAAPIVLLKRKRRAQDCPIAPDNPYLGVLLPYTPLHHILLRQLDTPVIATSGNLSDEPICTGENEALSRLSGIADLFLVHNRPIARHVDDSIARVLLGRNQLLRRARGYVPLPIVCGEKKPATRSLEETTVIAMGGHLKNCIALSFGNSVIQSQHIGDLETPLAYRAFQQSVQDLPALHGQTPTVVATDMHPDYRSTRESDRFNIPVLHIQHHEAHALSCMAEHGLHGPVLAVVWDGTGYGADGTLWGGEFLHLTPQGCHRAAFFRPFPLPGGEQAMRQPRRAALGLLYQMYGDDAFEMTHLPPFDGLSERERRVIQRTLTRQINSPLTSSVGRLFDAYASLLGLFQDITFEGQAATGLEYAIGDSETDDAYPFRIQDGHEPIGHKAEQAEKGEPRVTHWNRVGQRPSSIVDWGMMLQCIIDDCSKQIDVGHIAARIHHTLVAIIDVIARQLQAPAIVLSGGCFQNRYLTECAVWRLQQEGFQVYWQQQSPPNDGGLALGQVYGAWRRLSSQ